MTYRKSWKPPFPGRPRPLQMMPRQFLANTPNPLFPTINSRVYVLRKLWSKMSQEQTVVFWMVFSWQDSRAERHVWTYLDILPQSFALHLSGLSDFGPLCSLPLANWAVSICFLDKLRLRPFFSIQTRRILRIPQIPRPSHLAGQSCLTRNRCKNTQHGIVASVYRGLLSISGLGLYVFL